MPDLWYRLLFFALIRIYYRRVRVVGRITKSSGPVLYVGLHRNGAIDGMIYKSIAPDATFLISEQLTRSWFSRLFFTGIEVTRAKDAPSADRGSRNTDSLDRCVGHLVDGVSLFILPEGTSDLGPRHLPFKSGVALILERALAAGAPVRVVPMGIFYATPEAFRSDVTVVVGPDITTDGVADLDDKARTRELMARITAALETIGVNVETADDLDRVETMAAMAAPEPGAAYYARLKALETGPLPVAVREQWTFVSNEVAAGRLATDRGIPVLSRRGLIWNALWLCVQAPVVAAGALGNLPVVVGAWLAGRRLADARNTIALWRILVGATLAVFWTLAVLVGALALGHSLFILAWLAVTAAGIWLYPELRARWPRFRNAFRARTYRDPVTAISRWVDSLVIEVPAQAPAADDSKWRSDGPMVHEVGFAVLCVAAMMRLMLASGNGISPLLGAWIGVLVVIQLCAWVTHRWPGLTAWRIRLGAYLVIMNVVYLLLGPTVRATGAPLEDAALQHIDTVLFGRPVPLYFDALTSPVLSDLLSACYLVFFPYIVFSIGRQVWRARESLDVAKRFHMGMFTVYAAGFLGYLFVPAQGAYLAMPGAFVHQIAGGAITRLNDTVVRRGSIGIDVFPSLHVAVSTFMLLFDRRYARWRFYAYLGPAIGLWIATLYLRYHYGIDVLVGFVLALVVIWGVTREEPSMSPLVTEQP